MVELIPRQVLFGNPERVSPRISPNGTSLACIAPHNGVLNVWTAPVGADGVDWESARVVTADTDRGIRVFAWAHDGRHLLYLQDTGGDENWRLYDVDRLDLETGELAKEVENPGFAAWVADTELVTRVGIELEPDGSLVVHVRDGADDAWRPLMTLAAEDALTSEPVGISADGSTMVAISSAGADTGRLVRIDLATAAEQVLAEDPEADVSGVRLHPDTREPQVVTWLKERKVYRVLDPSVADDLA